MDRQSTCSHTSPYACTRRAHGTCTRTCTLAHLYMSVFELGFLTLRHTRSFYASYVSNWEIWSKHWLPFLGRSVQVTGTCPKPRPPEVLDWGALSGNGGAEGNSSLLSVVVTGSASAHRKLLAGLKSGEKRCRRCTFCFSFRVDTDVPPKETHWKWSSKRVCRHCDPRKKCSVCSLFRPNPVQ